MSPLRSRWFRVAALIAALVAVGFASRVLYDIVQFQMFSAEVRKLTVLIDNARRQPPPPMCTEHIWEELWGFNRSCISNSVSLPDYISRQQLQTLGQRIEAECRPPVTPETARNVFVLFGKACPHGRFYTTTWQKEFDRFYNAARGIPEPNELPLAGD